jgi:hypothetical protein
MVAFPQKRPHLPSGVLPLSSLAGYLPPLCCRRTWSCAVRANRSRSPGLAGETAVVGTLPALSEAETRAAEALLARVGGPGDVGVRGGADLGPQSRGPAASAHGPFCGDEKRVDKDTFGVELGALEYLNQMPEPVAPRLLGADADILLMGDLGPGPRWPTRY